MGYELLRSFSGSLFEILSTLFGYLEYPLLYVMKNLYHGKRGKRYQF